MRRVVELDKTQDFVNRAAVSKIKNQRVLRNLKSKNEQKKKLLNCDKRSLIKPNTLCQAN